MQAIMLEDFEFSDAVPPGPAPPPEPDPAILHAYERGLADAGQQADRRRADERDALHHALVNRLQDMAFGYHEARSALLHEVGALIEVVSRHFLPRLARAALPGLLLDALEPLLQASLEAPLLVIVHPDMRDAVAGMLPSPSLLPVRIEVDPDLSVLQVLIRQPHVAEHLLDADAALQGVDRLLAAFVQEMSRGGQASILQTTHEEFSDARRDSA